MKLVSMKMDPAELKEKQAEYAQPSKPELPVYPWGLTVRLDEDSIAKLGLTSLPDAGNTLMLMAKVDVTEVSSREEMENGKPHTCRSLCLQITDLALGDVPDDKDAAKALYK
jgi:hypothetical protein